MTFRRLLHSSSIQLKFTFTEYQLGGRDKAISICFAGWRRGGEIGVAIGELGPPQPSVARSRLMRGQPAPAPGMAASTCRRLGPRHRWPRECQGKDKPSGIDTERD